MLALQMTGSYFCLVSVGVITVGVSDENVNTERNPVLGDALTITGMFFWAGQLTYEEKYIKEHNVSPIQALGLEGFFWLCYDDVAPNYLLLRSDSV